MRLMRYATVRHWQRSHMDQNWPFPTILPILKILRLSNKQGLGRSKIIFDFIMYLRPDLVMIISVSRLKKPLTSYEFDFFLK